MGEVFLQEFSHVLAKRQIVGLGHQPLLFGSIAKRETPQFKQSIFLGLANKALEGRVSGLSLRLKEAAVHCVFRKILGLYS